MDGLQLAPDMGWTVNQLLATFSQLIISMERDSYFSQGDEVRRVDAVVNHTLSFAGFTSR